MRAPADSDFRVRVLCTVTGSSSHARALLPLVSALAAAGHAVLVAAPPQFVPGFAARQVRTAGIMADLHAHMARRFREGGSPEPGPPGAAAVEFFAGPHLAESCAALLPAARDFGPDLLVRDGGELAGCLVAEVLGIPHVAAPSGAANHLDPVRLLPVLNGHRARLGLPAADDPQWIHRHGRLDCMPPALSFMAHPAATTFAYRQPADVDPAEVLPGWMAGLPTDRPLVIAAVGTVLPMLPGLPGNAFGAVPVLNSVVAGLAQLDCVALVATGGLPVEHDPALGGVHLVDRFPQPLLLRCAQLLVTHGGYNSIREAVGAGVPMAVAPRFGDQPANADRVRQLGLGDSIADPDAVPDPGRVASVCGRLLGDARIAEQVRGAQRQILTLPPVESAVAGLERLAHGAH
ncbi:glycosyl transferase [Streptomyces morookaense]|nr:glycosyl transferase [Streptomyces morookaense]